MGIDRGPWNALVDDDGSNLVGTVWNKDTIKTVILDPIDAGLPWTLVSPALPPGYQHNWNPGIVGHTVIVLSHSTGGTIEITGFQPAAPFVGQRVHIVHIGGAPSNVVFHHDHSFSSAANQLHLRAGSLTIGGFWGVAEFQYSLYAGVGGWVLGMAGSGQGAFTGLSDTIEPMAETP
jgi:hypothetical protein